MSDPDRLDGPPTPLDQGAFLEAIGVDPNEVLRDTTSLEFDGDMIKITWTGFKMVSTAKLMFALAEADEEAARAAAERTAAMSTPTRTSTKRATPKYDDEEDYAVEETGR